MDLRLVETESRRGITGHHGLNACVKRVSGMLEQASKAQAEARPHGRGMAIGDQALGGVARWEP